MNDVWREHIIESIDNLILAKTDDKESVDKEIDEIWDKISEIAAKLESIVSEMKRADENVLNYVMDKVAMLENDLIGQISSSRENLGARIEAEAESSRADYYCLSDRITAIENELQGYDP